MKRNKIKPKYLNNNIEKKDTVITSEISLEQELNPNKFSNALDTIEHKIIKSLVTLGLIMLMLFGNVVPMVIMAMFGIDYSKFSEFGKIIYMFICDLLILGILIKIYYKDLKKNFKEFFNHNFKKNVKMAFCYWGIGLLIMVVSNELIYVVTNGKIAANEESVRNLIQMAPWLMAFELMIYAPLTEELIFRKSIRDIVNNRYIYAILSGCIFGGLHVISSLEGAIDLLYLIPYCSLGIAFALLYHKTDNIFSTVTVHAFHNTLALILYLIAL